jgi:biotin carboxylase
LSGSELTYFCDRQEDAVEAVQTIKKGLQRRSRDKIINRDHLIDENSFLCEEFIPGDEYSCDFICNGSGVTIIRTARKYLMEEGPAGTVQAYEVPGMPREKAEALNLRENIAEAIEVLGLERCMGMADFIIHNGEPYFLEITPRPGGDCLPQVIEHSCGMNILEAHIDFAAERDLRIPPESEWKRTVGLRVHARKRGSLSTIRLWVGRISQEILETGWYREAGDRISLPPDDYRTWVLGHIIFRPHPDVGIPEQIKDISEAIEVRIE